MSNEIKVGDKVRVSKDAPRVYIGGIDFYFTKLVSVVKDIDNGNAALECETTKTVLSIPTKYLVKVEDEKPKIKVGDYVRLKQNCSTRKIYRRFKEWVSTVEKIEDGKADIRYWGCALTDIPLNQLEKVDALEYYHVITQSDLVKDFDPKEHRVRNDEPSGINAPMGRMSDETHEAIERAARKLVEYSAFPDMADNFDWQAYTAELAHDVAVAYAEKGRYEPGEIGAKAVVVAKSVVENLKKK